MARIRVDNLRKTFGSFEALKSVSLDVRDQEFTVLLGPSGCGKTTLLRIIAGLETETAGHVQIGERRVNGLAPRARDIAMVFQNYAVFPHMTVFENIAFGLRMKKLPDAEIELKVARAAEMMHIEQLLDRYSGQLSGGATPAGRGGAGARGRATGAADGRAALQPRCAAPPRDASRAQRAFAAI